MRMKLIILFSLSILLGYLAVVKSTPTTLFRKGVYIGEYNFSNKTWKEAEKIIEDIFDTPIYINIENTSRAITLTEIGISIDTDVLSRYTKICKIRNPSLLCTNTSNEPIDSSKIIKRDIEKLNNYLDSLETELQFAAENTIISFEDYSFRKLSPEARILVDRALFLDEERVNGLVSEHRIKIKINTTAEDDKEKQFAETKDLIEKISTPLLVKYGGKPIYIPADYINGFIETEERGGMLYGKISDTKVKTYIEEIKPEYENKDVKIIDREGIDAIRRALLYRAAEPNTTVSAVLPIEGNPRTDGTLHDVYLEVVKPQQRLYRFEGGELVKTYVISTGLTWDTPAGKYSVMGKQKLTISYFGNWYMPDYLPIGTINGYRFGFHAIPYHMDAAGNIYSRDINTMGSPATGGCIQLKPDQATELFDWAKVGIPVYVYD